MPVIHLQIDAEYAADEFEGRLDALNLLPLHRDIGEYMLLETDDRFVKEEAPDGTPWEPLSPATLAMKKTDKILQEKGNRGGLRGSIHYDPQPDGVTLSANKIYADVHQLGFDDEVEVPAHTRTITQAFGRPLDEPKEVEVEAHTRHMRVPARPFLGMSDENEEVIAQMIATYVKQEL